jgi:hypothetical protein
MRLRSTLNPEEQRNVVEGPTKYRRGPNQFKPACALCNEIYYFDEATFRKVLFTMAEGGDNPFCCDECETDLDELSH